jgi:GMP synthase-like glutamine amidotransferase
VKPILIVQHGEAEGPARLADVLRGEGCELVVLRVDRDEPVPRVAAPYAALVVMGGAMSAASDDNFATRRAEIALLKDALTRSTPTLGICLGAQLLAAAGGALVYPGATFEIGWRPVILTDAAADDSLLTGVDGPLDVLHWHGDTFDLPVGAARLAESSLYPNQAFRLGPAAWGLQFHVEVDEATVEGFIAESPDEAQLAPGGSAEIRSHTRIALRQLRDVQRHVGSRFAAIAQQVPHSS